MSLTPNLTLSYHIQRPNDSSLVNATLELPFLNIVQNNNIELLSDDVHKTNLVYNIMAPFPYTASSNISVYGDQINTATNVVTEDYNILASNFSGKEFANGTLIIQTTQNSGKLMNDNLVVYPIYYFVNLTANIVSYMNVNVTISNNPATQGVLERLATNKVSKQLLKTRANRQLSEKFSIPITPALLKFHSLPNGYHDSSSSSIIRIDNEWSLQSGEYSTLVESTTASTKSDNRPLQVVLPSNAAVDTTFPLIIYRRENEIMPTLQLGSMVNGSFVASQSIRVENYINSKSFIVDSSNYIVDVKLFIFNTDTELWDIKSFHQDRNNNIFKHLTIQKDSHVQKHFMADNDEIRLSFNGVRLQALSLKGSQIQFITAKPYFSSITNTENNTRIIPSRYFSLNRESIYHTMNQQELFEDQLSTGDALRQVNTGTNATAILYNTDLQNLTTAFGNGTASFGSSAYILNGNHHWIQDMPFQWSDFVQSDNNLTLYTPYTGLSSTTQTLNMSYIFNLKLIKDVDFSDTCSILTSHYRIPNSTSTSDNNLLIEIQAVDNTSTGGGFDLQTYVFNETTNAKETTTIATNLTTDIWNRVGIDLSSTWSKSGSNWTISNMYAKTASYYIPNNVVLDGTQRYTLTKLFPSGSNYNEINLTTASSPHTLDGLGTIDTNNLTITTSISNSTSVSLSDNLTTYLDELEIYTARPIHTNVLGGIILNNPYH